MYQSSELAIMPGYEDIATTRVVKLYTLNWRTIDEKLVQVSCAMNRSSPVCLISPLQWES